jgi:PAS domain S-box-containing protein
MRDTSTTPLSDLRDPVIAELVVANAREYAIMILDERGIITAWSQGAERIFGYSADEILGRPVAELFVPSDVAAGAHQAELDTARTDGRAEDSRWHLHKNGGRFWGNGMAMRLETGGRRGFLKILRDETKSKLADEQRVLLLNELNHRIKNTLATVQGIAEQTLRAAQVDPRTRENLTERLLALSKAHDVLVDENWAGADLEAIVGHALAPHDQAARFQVDGPPVRLSPPQAVSLSLALHELATNAVKYGGLSTAAGTVAVTWNIAVDGHGGRHMNLLWEESGGPTVRKPEQTGFGTRLITRHFGRESGGSARLDYEPDGLRCVLQLPLSGPEEIPILDLRSTPSRASARGLLA